MIKLLKYLAIFAIISLSCSIPIIPPKLAPAACGNEVIEAFKLFDGRIYIVKSEIVPGMNYWDASTREPQRKRVWIEVYAAVGGRIMLILIRPATRIPAQPERWEFKDFEKEIK